MIKNDCAAINCANLFFSPVTKKNEIKKITCIFKKFFMVFLFRSTMRKLAYKQICILRVVARLYHNDWFFLHYADLYEAAPFKNLKKDPLILASGGAKQNESLS